MWGDVWKLVGEANVEGSDVYVAWKKTKHQPRWGTHDVLLHSWRHSPAQPLHLLAPEADEGKGGLVHAGAGVRDAEEHLRDEDGGGGRHLRRVCLVQQPVAGLSAGT